MHPLFDAALRATRHGIDRVDDAMLLLLANRRLLVAAGSRIKSTAGLPAHNPARERQVHQRVQRLAARLRVPAETASRLTALMIDEAHRQQGIPRTVSSDSARSSPHVDEGESTRSPSSRRSRPPSPIIALRQGSRLARAILDASPF